MARFRERRWQVEGAERALPRSNLPTHQIPLESSSPFYISKLYAAKNRHLLRKNPSKANRLPSVFFLEPVNFQHAPCHTRIVFTQPRPLVSVSDRIMHHAPTARISNARGCRKGQG